MQTEGDPPRSLFLTAPAADQPTAATLCLDVTRPQQIVEVAGLRRSVPELRRAIVVVNGDQVAGRARGAGGLMVNRGLLWSLLDPGSAGAACWLRSEDPLDAERKLRAEGRKFWRRLRWWRELPAQLRDECRKLLAPLSRPAAELVDYLERLASGLGTDPFTGWTDEPGPDEAPAPGVTSAAGTEGKDEAAQTVQLPEDAEGMAAWLGDPAGLGVLYGPRFTPRVEQGDMAREVARCLAERRPLLIEAGTGVGKTLAYLVPLLAAVRQHGCRAVVSTHTRALQIQLLAHDMPLLAPVFPELRARLLMGRSNYLCRRQELHFLGRSPASAEDALEVVCVRLWLAETRTGMREELANHPLLKNRLHVLFDGAEPCSPAACYEENRCFVQKARREARSADLLVVNHSLLMHDLASQRALIGPYDYLVVDEAHRLPQVALQTHGLRCDAQRMGTIRELLASADDETGPSPLLAELAGLLPSPDAAAGGSPAAALAELGQQINRCMAAYGRWWQLLGEVCTEKLPEGPRPPGRLRVHDPEEAFGLVRPFTQELLEAAAAAVARYAEVGQKLEALPELPAGAEESLGTLASLGQLLDSLQHDVRFLTGAADEEWVTWLEPGAGPGIRALGATRLEAGELLRDYWRANALQPILTSGTLAVSEDFGHMLGELGLRQLQPATATALVASPFDYQRQALFLTLPEMPAPDQADYSRAVAKILRELQHRVPRKTLALFTSYQAMQRVAGELADQTDADDLFAAGSGSSPAPGSMEILVQEAAGGTTELLERFRRLPRGLLLGTTTFWEGVDFPGSALEVLVVTKLPFLVPSDPWVEARSERIQAGGDNPFTTFMVRDAILRLRQGLGRLIRRQTDRGVVMLLDNRLHSKRYGVTFLSALPAPARLCRNDQEMIGRAEEFFASGGG